MSINRRTALLRAAVTRSWAVGMCDNFCANMYGWTASGYVDAVAHWKALPAAVRHSGDREVPAGMLAFWSGGHGHVAISAGGGDVWSTDIAGAGTVARVPLARIAADWGKPYLGWGEPVFQGVEWSEDVISGYDIAGYQPVNFSTAGIDFVFMKITEGTTYTNPNWVGQRATARAANLVCGFYHFVRPGSMTAQADFFLSKIFLQPGDIIALDWEDTGVTSGQKDQWIRYVQTQRPGHRVILYCNKDYWLNRDASGFAGDGLWIADPDYPAGSPHITSPWLIHQYSETNGYDHDVAQFSSRAAMSVWAGGEGAPVALTDAEIVRVWAYSHGDEPDMHAQLVTAATKSTAAAASAALAVSKASAIAAQAAANGEALSALSLKADGLATAVANLETTGLTPAQVSQIGTEVKGIVMGDDFLTVFANKMADVNAARMAD